MDLHILETPWIQKINNTHFLWIELGKRGVTTWCVQKPSLLQYSVSSIVPPWDYEAADHLSKNQKTWDFWERFSYLIHLNPSIVKMILDVQNMSGLGAQVVWLKGHWSPQIQRTSSEILGLHLPSARGRRPQTAGFLYYCALNLYNNQHIEKMKVNLNRVPKLNLVIFLLHWLQYKLESC